MTKNGSEPHDIGWLLKFLCFFYLEYVVERPGVWVPVSFERIHANFSLFRDVWMENFGQEIALWCLSGKLLSNDQLNLEDASLVRRAICLK